MIASAPSKKSGQPSHPDPALAVCRTQLRSGWLNSKGSKAQRQQVTAAVAAASPQQASGCGMLHLLVAPAAGNSGQHQQVMAARASLSC